jgi:hypothetical protein
MNRKDCSLPYPQTCPFVVAGGPCRLCRESRELDENKTSAETPRGALPGGYTYYCSGCDLLFSVPADRVLPINYCPACGWAPLVKDREIFERDYPHKVRRAG